MRKLEVSDERREETDLVLFGEAEAEANELDLDLLVFELFSKLEENQVTVFFREVGDRDDVLDFFGNADFLHGSELGGKEFQE